MEKGGIVPDKPSALTGGRYKGRMLVNSPSVAREIIDGWKLREMSKPHSGRALGQVWVFQWIL